MRYYKKIYILPTFYLLFEIKRKVIILSVITVSFKLYDVRD